MKVFEYNGEPGLYNSLKFLSAIWIESGQGFFNASG